MISTVEVNSTLKNLLTKTEDKTARGETDFEIDWYLMGEEITSSCSFIHLKHSYGNYTQNISSHISFLITFYMET